MIALPRVTIMQRLKIGLSGTPDLERVTNAQKAERNPCVQDGLEAL
jgi:hypothetical protein